MTCSRRANLLLRGWRLLRLQRSPANRNHRAKRRSRAYSARTRTATTFLAVRKRRRFTLPKLSRRKRLQKACSAPRTATTTTRMTCLGRRVNLHRNRPPPNQKSPTSRPSLRQRRHPRPMTPWRICCDREPHLPLRNRTRKIEQIKL
uniref:(northern house mosquito) hypothetical protein n=1 Tax=Culex pipiens TaxID=7175 RepID=A0A8D8E2U6_CULPI